MNYRSLQIAFLVSIGVLFSARSQQQASAVDWEAYGYLNGVFSGISQESQYQGMDYLLHHRLNIDGYLTKNSVFTLGLEIGFYGVIHLGIFPISHPI